MPARLRLPWEEGPMGRVVVERLTEPQAVARRAEIIEAAGGDERAFRARAADFALDARELALYDELEELDYLLGRERH
ncbi:hypothetical protein MF406_02730 [Georgenia sp. TF02-10]|uniref:hypothetical protein n=1 Tax=Georgenia sp. TF02-10 TaxID=2917725 RepID=UPI001FA7E5ED|nr:hypothetical protein [Georgenia sp. TF02-10]UNX55216.1 hypothetical protein MF406_02730 [Georgenia sp. TF02-10]